MLYHYTDRLSGADIRKGRSLRAAPCTLHKDPFGQDEGFTTQPIVWLTINPIIDLTVVAKMKLGGWPSTLLQDVWRFVLPGDYAPMGLGDYIDAFGIDPAWCDWMVRTGRMAGSDYTTWRLHPQDIPERDWLRIEILTGVDSARALIWTPCYEKTS